MSLHSRTPQSRQAHHQRSAFTLIEMLVTIGIILILTVVTAVSVNVAFSTDRLAGSARQLQSFLEGARDRAIFAKEPRGVRFQFDANNPNVVSSMIYISAPVTVLGTLDIDDNGQRITEKPGSEVEWQTLANSANRLVQPGSRIEIPSGSNQWFTLDKQGFTVQADGTYTLGAGVMRLTRQHPDYISVTGTDIEFTLELIPGLLPDQTPTRLIEGVVVDLKNSQFPSSWQAGSNFTASRKMDILFSPRGTVMGKEAAHGLIHFLLADAGDVANGLDPGDPNKEGDELVVTLFTRTGQITTNRVFMEVDSNENSTMDTEEDINGDGVLNRYNSNPDPFYYAETGESSQ